MRLVIIGAGFAGMYAALSAARLRDIQGFSPEELEIALVAPEPTLVVRPRLYEPKPETLTAPLLDVLNSIDVVYVQGSAASGSINAIGNAWAFCPPFQNTSCSASTYSDIVYTGSALSPLLTTSCTVGP